MGLQKQLSLAKISSSVMLPLRLFLGGTFVYAGVQKFTDSQFLRPDTPGYIGKQLVAFASGSPLHILLLQIAVPHALFFGYLVAYTELVIGLCVLFGSLLRPMALLGLLSNALFFLSATWRVYPFFYGSDIVFVFCWLTLLLNGPVNTGLPTFDELLAVTLVQYSLPHRQLARARLLSLLLGVPESQTLPDVALIQTEVKHKAIRHNPQARRNFLVGAFSGGAGMLAVLGVFYLLSKVLKPYVQPAPVVSPPSSTPGAGGGPSSPAGGHAAAGSTIARASAVPLNKAVPFILASSGDPAVLIHTHNDKFVAFNTTCTHEGCEVTYDSSIHLLVCPCHGAEFDPDQQASPIQGPATRPLTSVAIHIDSTTGAITLQ